MIHLLNTGFTVPEEIESFVDRSVPAIQNAPGELSYSRIFLF